MTSSLTLMAACQTRDDRNKLHTKLAELANCHSNKDVSSKQSKRQKAQTHTRSSTSANASRSTQKEKRKREKEKKKQPGQHQEK